MEEYFSDKVERYVLARSWRSLWGYHLLFTAFCAASLSYTADSEYLLLRDKLSLGSYQLELGVPLLWLGAVFIFLREIFIIYDATFVITPHHLHCTTGILSLSKRFVEISYEDLMGVEVDKGIPGRILDYGDIEVGTAETPQHEISFAGVAHPDSYAKIISHQIDRARVERRVKPVEQILSEVEHQIEAFKSSAAHP